MSITTRLARSLLIASLLMIISGCAPRELDRVFIGEDGRQVQPRTALGRYFLIYDSEVQNYQSGSLADYLVKGLHATVGSDEPQRREQAGIDLRFQTMEAVQEGLAESPMIAYVPMGTENSVGGINWGQDNIAQYAKIKNVDLILFIRATFSYEYGGWGKNDRLTLSHTWHCFDRTGKRIAYFSSEIKSDPVVKLSFGGNDARKQEFAPIYTSMSRELVAQCFEALQVAIDESVEATAKKTK